MSKKFRMQHFLGDPVSMMLMVTSSLLFVFSFVFYLMAHLYF